MPSYDTQFIPKVTNIIAAWAQAINDKIWKGRNPLYATSTYAAGAQFTLTSGVAASGSYTITYAANTNVAVGQAVAGTGIPASTFIASVLSSTSATITKQASASGSGLTFTISRNNYAITLPTTSLLSSLSAGDKFTWKVHAANGGAATLTIIGSASLGPYDIKRAVAALAGGQLPLSGIVETVFDGTQFQLIGQPVFDSTSYEEINLLSVASGIYSGWRTLLGQISYGVASNVYNDGGTGMTVGGQFSAYSTSSASSGTMWGVVSQAIANPGSKSAVIGSELAIVNESSSGTTTAVALTGYIAGEVLTVVTTTATIDALRGRLTGAGVAANTFTIAQLSGTPNGVGTYKVFPAQTVSSGPTGQALTITSTTPKIAIDAVFKDRYDYAAGADFAPGATTEVLGVNKFNTNAVGLSISSQFPSSRGEHCGFRYGIRFEEYALDEDVNGKAIGIDFAPIHYLAPGSPGPLNSYPMTAAIRLRDFMSILWNADIPASNWSSDTEPPTSVGIRTYYDSTLTPTPQWKLCTTSAGVVTDMFGIDVTYGHLYLAADAVLLNAGVINLNDSGGYATTAWTNLTLQNSWVDYGGADTSVPGYYKDAIGRVHLRGSVKSGNLALAIATLPAGYRPAGYVDIPVVSASSVGPVVMVPCLIIISPVDGTIGTAGTGDNFWVALDGVSFKAA
jgi:hypothetical protein